MTIKAGEKMPSGAFKTMTAEGAKEVGADALFAGKTVVLFAMHGICLGICNTSMR